VPAGLINIKWKNLWTCSIGRRNILSCYEMIIVSITFAHETNVYINGSLKTIINF
jgi:hypothetical protein